VFVAASWPTPPPTTRRPAGQLSLLSSLLPGSTERVPEASIVASEPAEQIAKTWKSRALAPKLKTDAYQPSATSPVSVFAVVPVASTGPLDRIQPNRGLVGSGWPSPPPSARWPAGQSTDAPSTVRGSTVNGFAAMVASELAEQIAASWNSVVPLAPG
jgi:hypothetical protein